MAARGDGEANLRRDIRGDDGDGVLGSHKPDDS